MNMVSILGSTGDISFGNGNGALRLTTPTLLRFTEILAAFADITHGFGTISRNQQRGLNADGTQCSRVREAGGEVQSERGTRLPPKGIAVADPNVGSHVR